MTTVSPSASDTATARDYPRIITPLPGPRGREIIARDEQWASTSNIKEYPLVVSRGKGAMVEDVDGNRFLDFMAGIAVASTGHCHPAVVAAIQEAASRFLHICAVDFYYEGVAALSERLSKLAPGPSRKRTFLANSGAETIDGAMKLARYATRRPAIIAFNGSFHGRTYGALSLTASKAIQRSGFGPLVPEIYHTNYPNPYRAPEGTNAAGSGRAAIAAIETDLFARRLDPRDVAAIFVEPIQGEGGYIVPPDGFLRALRELCDRHGILLVADEVQSGIGRTGKMFACDHEGVEPDILCAAKGLASGMPLGAIIAKESVMTWSKGAHGSTFGGNPVCCAAALATLDVVEGGLMENAARMGERLMGDLRGLAGRHSAIGDVRGRGLMIGVELVKDRRSKEPWPELVHDAVQRAFESGLLILPAGKSTIRLAPPMVIDDTDVDVALEILDRSLLRH